MILYNIVCTLFLSKVIKMGISLFVLIILDFLVLFAFWRYKSACLYISNSLKNSYYLWNAFASLGNYRIGLPIYMQIIFQRKWEQNLERESCLYIVYAHFWKLIKMGISLFVSIILEINFFLLVYINGHFK